MALGGGGGEGKASFHDFNFTHHVDKASPVLMKACATGEHIKEATITRAQGRQGPAGVPDHQDERRHRHQRRAGRLRRRRAPSESGRLQFAKVDLEYKPQKADGSLDAGLHFKYDIKAQQGRLAAAYGVQSVCYEQRDGSPCGRRRHVPECQRRQAWRRSTANRMDDKHKGEIEVLSWSWGMQGKASLGGGAASGKATIRELKIVKKVDKASTALMGALRTNEVIKEAVLTLRKAGKSAARIPEDHDRAGPRHRRSTIEAGDRQRQPDAGRARELFVQQDRGRVHAAGRRTASRRAARRSRINGVTASRRRPFARLSDAHP